MDADKVLFAGEVQLISWSETSNNGAKIVLALADPDDLAPFRTMTLKKGKQAGQRLMIAISEIGEDEQPVPQEKEPRPKGGELAMLAGKWCSTIAFASWLSGHRRLDPAIDEAINNFQISFAGPLSKATHEELATSVVRRVCNIKSRAELDHSPAAKALFDRHFRLPFSSHLRQEQDNPGGF